MEEASNFLPISRKVLDVYISIGEKGDKIQKEIKCFNCVSLLHQIKNYIALYCVGYFEKLSCAPQKRHLKREKERPYWGIEWKICSCLSSPKTSFWTGVWRADLYLYSTVHLFLDLTINCRVLCIQYSAFDPSSSALASLRQFWEITHILYITCTFCDQQSGLQGVVRTVHSTFSVYFTQPAQTSEGERERILIWALRIVFDFTTDCLALKNKRIGILRFYIYCFYRYIEKSNFETFSR